MNNKVLVNGISVLIFRMSLSGIFITAGISHLINPEEVANRINTAVFGQFAGSIGDPYFLGLITGYFLLIFGLLLFSGVFTRWSALILFMLLIPITITIQLGNGIVHGPLWKNIALFGGLLFFIVNNPKIFSIYNKSSETTMYKYIILITMTIAILGAGNIYGQSESEVLQTEQAVKMDGKYGILVMKAQHLKAAILTGKQLKDKSQRIDFHILICGELVREISNEVELQEVIRVSVADNGLKILVCGLSIQQFQVDTKNLPNEASITENGLLYMFGLQEQGYKTVVL